MKIIVSSAAMRVYLAKIMEFLREDAKVIIFENELQIDGFKSLGVEHKGPTEMIVSVQKLREFQRFLGTITDQPITVTFDYWKIYVHSIII